MRFILVSTNEVRKSGICIRKAHRQPSLDIQPLSLWVSQMSEQSRAPISDQTPKRTAKAHSELHRKSKDISSC